MRKAFINWSSGKDAALALYALQQQKELRVERLVTTVNTKFDRISMHGLRKELLVQQAERLQIPLHVIPLSGNLSMGTYNDRMKKETSVLVSEGFTHSVYGDIFLEDLREYREKQLDEVGLKAVFPLWQRDTAALMREFLSYGFKAVIVCVNAKVLDESFCGRIISEQLLLDLPEGVDPCGENGEFHTFVFDGPNFSTPVNYKIGEKVFRRYEPTEKKKENCYRDKQESWDTGFWYSDLLPE